MISLTMSSLHPSKSSWSTFENLELALPLSLINDEAADIWLVHPNDWSADPVP
jgi:hypothetical protein